jgi:hypothetical protein
MLITTLLTVAAMAQDPGSPWDSPGHGSAPDALGVRTALAVAPQTEGTRYAFSTLTADAPWFSARINPDALVSTRVRVSAVRMGVAAEGRSDLAPGNVQVEQWFGWRHGDRIRLSHGVYVGGYGPLGGQLSTVFVHTNELASSAGGYTGYHLYADAPRVDLAVDLSVGLGVGPIELVELGGTQLSVHGFFELRDDLPLVAGVVLTPWVSHVQLGARWRPTEHLDAGLGVNVPALGVMGPQPVVSEVFLLQPMFDLQITL